MTLLENLESLSEIHPIMSMRATLLNMANDVEFFKSNYIRMMLQHLVYQESLQWYTMNSCLMMLVEDFPRFHYDYKACCMLCKTRFPPDGKLFRMHADEHHVLSAAEGEHACTYCEKRVFFRTAEGLEHHISFCPAYIKMRNTIGLTRSPNH